MQAMTTTTLSMTLEYVLCHKHENCWFHWSFALLMLGNNQRYLSITDFYLVVEYGVESTLFDKFDINHSYT